MGAALAASVKEAYKPALPPLKGAFKWRPRGYRTQQ